MNRLSYGAIGLLLALSLTAMIPNANCDNAHNDDKEECTFGTGTLNKREWDHMTRDEVLALSEDQMKEFVIATAKSMFGSGRTFLPDDMVGKLESCKQLKVYAHYVHNAANRRLNKMLESGLHKNTKLINKMKEFQDKMKDHTNIMSEKTGIKSREDWNKIYGTNPETEKYSRTGLSPGVKQSLYSKFSSVDRDAYNTLKTSSADHLSSIAMEARLEAIRQSKTAAGEYFKDHQNELDALYSELHKHNAIGKEVMMKDDKGNDMPDKHGMDGMTHDSLVHKCKHFCASCCEKQGVCNKDKCDESKNKVG